MPGMSLSLNLSLECPVCGTPLSGDAQAGVAQDVALFGAVTGLQLLAAGRCPRCKSKAPRSDWTLERLWAAIDFLDDRD
jgi:hypothetical protein